MNLGWLIPVDDKDVAEIPELRAVIDDYVRRGLLKYSVNRCRHEWVMPEALPDVPADTKSVR